MEIIGRVLLAGLALASPAAPVSPATLVFLHGRIHTQAIAQPLASALAIAHGRIVYVGDDAGAQRYVGAATRTIDLKGRTVLPGLHDSHVHLLGSGLEALDCMLTNLKGREAVIAQIRRYALAHPKAAWVQGGGWELHYFPGGNPRKEWLDRAVPDRPAFFASSDGHSAWANSKALARAGITRATRDPVGGRIERDPKTHEPTGTLREAATELVSTLLPKSTDADRRQALANSLVEANRVGITAAIDANDDEVALRIYREAERAGKMTVRLAVAQETDTLRGAEQVPALVAHRATYMGDLVRPTMAKIFVDGVIESRTAWVLEPYLDAKTGRPTKERGRTSVERKLLIETFEALDKAGFQVHMHAIGDAGVRLALDATAAAQAANGVRDARHTIAHLELIDPADVPRFKALGVVADFQPLWAQRDIYITDMTEPILGAARSRRLYPIGEVVRSGCAIAFGSDWSVTSLNPFDAMQVAVTRRGQTAAAGAPWLPDQVVDLATAVAGYTTGGAYASHREADLGSLEVNKAADLVVLDRPLFELPPPQIHLTRPLLTLLAGRAVYRDPKSTDFAAVPAWNPLRH